MGNPTSVQAVSDVAPSTHVQQITGFVDDATQQTASLPFLTTPALPIIGDSMEVRDHTLIDVLSRPVQVRSGTWSDTNPDNAGLEELSFPQVLFDAAPNIVDKLNYFAYLRADVCIRIMVNANTFQQGKLLGYFSPFEEFTGDRFLSTNFPSSYTTYPYIIVDASVGNSADLRIPYVAPYSSYALEEKIGNIGTFYLKVLNTLFSGTCNYSIYAWFSNISVDLPSGRENALTSTSTLERRIRRAAKNDPETIEKLLSGFEGQAAGEAEQKSSGIVSATLHTVSDIGTALTSVPLLAPVASPVAWVSKALAGVAEYFGWSKPLDLSNLQKYENVPGYGYTQGTGTDSGVVLASTQDNSIEQRGDIFGNNVDEMEISWIVAHKCFVKRFSMNVDQTVFTELISFPVTPGWCTFTSREYQPTITAYVASMFRYWRGGLKYRIQAVKTAYHSGRLRIIYIPRARSNEVDAADQAYNWVFDLRNSNEIEFEVPYNNFVEWERVGLTDELNNTFSTGVIRIEVLNELRAPSSVSDTIQFNIWISGADDLQFAVPDISRYVPSLLDPDSVRNDEFVAQVLGTAQDMGFNDMSEKPCMFETTRPDRIVPCKMAMGEMVRNLRVLTRRFGKVNSVGLADASLTVTQSFPTYFFGKALQATEPVGSFRASPVDYISWIYKFFRGGMRFKSFYSGRVTAGGDQKAVVLFNSPFRNSGDAVAPDFFERTFNSGGAFTHRVFNNVNPVLEVTVPFYSQTPIRPLQDPNSRVLSDVENISLLTRFERFNAGNNEELSVYKAAADDFTFGWLVGPPYLLPFLDSFMLSLDTATLATFVVSEAPTGTYSIVSGDAQDLPIAPGSYRIQSATIANIPIVFDIGGVPTAFNVPVTEFFFNYAVSANPQAFTWTLKAQYDQPSGSIFNPSDSLVAVQNLGDQTFELQIT